eukprot:TRINITY_DN12184_c0_g1_i1.p1 TRINITY_DN12184_c0_g1~~TRINITY_DN12184_c0_g1_i1.p1  ORF type:complete len:171 (-),score=32.38 TRINITY_DN12184_c0_g1_i1:532-1044(-)
MAETNRSKSGIVFAAYEGGKWVKSKEDMIKILQRVDDERLNSSKLQDRYDEKDDFTWFSQVTHEMHKDILVNEFGYKREDAEEVVDEVYCARYNYRFDPEMNKFFDTLVHVRMDFTGDGPIKIGDPIPRSDEMKLFPIHKPEGTFITLADAINDTKAKHIPLVVFSGSWT